MDQYPNKYIPGVCNIGPAEIRARKLVGWCGLLVTVALWGLFAWQGVPAAWKWILFIPVFSSAIGFQAGRTDTISQAEFRKMDRGKALQILGCAALIALGITLVVYFI
jgi:hypothetical protein